MRSSLVLALVIAAGSIQAASEEAPAYTWLSHYDAHQTVLARVPAPEGYTRAAVAPGSYAEWLRTLPLKKGCPPVRLYNGGFRLYQHYHCAVIDMDVGKSDLQ
ncbi:MAG: hypothetical protein IT368_17975, partial [Candidatus Hydrogenedentes bacterium]|nr:hypothetical protein [Candidatus Hydrogenedentota bacterium]